MNYIKEAFINIFKQKYNSLLVFFAVLIFVFVSLFFVSLIYNVDIVSNNYQSAIRLVVFLNDDFKEIENIKKEIEKIANVNSVKKFNPNSTLKAIYNENVISLPEVLEVIVKQKDITLIKSKIEKMNGVEEVLSNKLWLDKFFGVLNFIKNISYGFMFLFILIGVFLIFYANRVFTMVRKEEFALMKLFGASENRIIFPNVISISVLTLFGFISGSLFFNFMNLVLKELITIINWNSIGTFYYLIVFAFVLILIIATSFLAFYRCKDD